MSATELKKLYFRVCAEQEVSCNLKGIFNALNKVLCLASAMVCAEGNDKIVFTGIPLR